MTLHHLAKWTDQQTACLRKLWADPSITSTAIGDALGFTGKAVRSKARMMGLPKRTTGGARNPVTRQPAVAAPVFRLPGIISAPCARLSFINLPEPRIDTRPLRDRILDQLAKGPSDSLNLSSVCGAKEMLVSQLLGLLEGEGVVIWTPATGPRAKVWSLAERIAA